MTLFKYDTVFETTKVTKLFLGIPDITILSSRSAKTTRNDIIKFLLFELLTLLAGLYTVVFYQKILETGSEILDVGLQLVTSAGIFALFFSRLVFFCFRRHFWKILMCLNRCDKIVRLEYLIESSNFKKFIF